MNNVKDMDSRLKRLRKEHGLTLSQWADKAGVCPNTVKNWENGSSTPDANAIQSYCTKFKVSPNYLFGVEDNSLPIQYLSEAKELLSKICKLVP